MFHNPDKVLLESFFLSSGFYSTQMKNSACAPVRVRAIVPNPDAALKPGMFLTVDLQRDRGNVLLAPEQAIVPEGSAQFVYVVIDGIVEKRTVVLGRRIPGYVVIDEGLSPGDTVVTEGTHKLRDGSAIKVSDPDVANADI